MSRPRWSATVPRSRSRPPRVVALTRNVNVPTFAHAADQPRNDDDAVRRAPPSSDHARRRRRRSFTLTDRTAERPFEKVTGTIASGAGDADRPMPGVHHAGRSPARSWSRSPGPHAVGTPPINTPSPRPASDRRQPAALHVVFHRAGGDRRQLERLPDLTRGRRRTCTSRLGR